MSGGTLIICGTPLGNLEDMTARALRLLGEADVIAAEDTRHTRKLLNHYGITAPAVSYHRHNAAARGAELLERLKRGQSVALVTDAGMPCISDPGAELVRLCRDNGVSVTAAPGPTAVTTALALSGFEAARFVFEGFLPRKRGERREILSELRDQRRTLVFYEAPHHLAGTLEDMSEVLGARGVCLIREMTKIYEQALVFTLPEAVEYFAEETPRGEYVVVVEGASADMARRAEAARWEHMSAAEHVAMYERMGMDNKAAMKAAAKDRGVSKSVIYGMTKK